MKRYHITVNGTSYEVEVEEVSEGAAPAVSAAPVAPAVKPAAPAAGKGAPVTAPMQGTVLKVAVTVGQAVKKGDLICLLEAMKMENEIFAPTDGTVTAVPVTTGQSVAAGAVLATIA